MAAASRGCATHTRARVHVRTHRRAEVLRFARLSRKDDCLSRAASALFFHLRLREAVGAARVSRPPLHGLCVRARNRRRVVCTPRKVIRESVWLAGANESTWIAIPVAIPFRAKGAQMKKKARRHSDLPRVPPSVTSICRLVRDSIRLLRGPFRQSARCLLFHLSRSRRDVVQYIVHARQSKSRARANGSNWKSCRSHLSFASFFFYLRASLYLQGVLRNERRRGVGRFCRAARRRFIKEKRTENESLYGTRER